MPNSWFESVWERHRDGVMTAISDGKIHYYLIVKMKNHPAFLWTGINPCKIVKLFALLVCPSRIRASFFRQMYRNNIWCELPSRIAILLLRPKFLSSTFAKKQCFLSWQHFCFPYVCRPRMVLGNSIGASCPSQFLSLPTKFGHWRCRVVNSIELDLYL